MRYARTRTFVLALMAILLAWRASSQDVKQTDFTITEDGKVQKILSIDVQNTDALSANSGELQALNLLGDLNGSTATRIQQEARERAKEPAPTEYTKETLRDRR